MKMINRSRFSDLRGAVGLAVDATVGVTDIVEKVHHTVQLGHLPFGKSRATATAGITGLVYRSIRGVTRAVGKGLDVGLAPASYLLPESASNPSRDAVVSAINGICGDHLSQAGNPLAIKMHLRYAGEELDLSDPVTGQASDGPENQNEKLLLFVHGLCLNESHWARDGFNRAQEMARKLGFTPVYLRYNTGLPIAENGRQLAMLLEKLQRNWPGPISSLIIAGHSMGGLVARSAVLHGSGLAHVWPEHLSSLVFIGTPHHGAPLERGGDWFDRLLELSPYAAPFAGIGKKRSAGINDLQHGCITDVRGQKVPLPKGVNCYALAATLADKQSWIHQRVIGDGMVPVDSALGACRDPDSCLGFPSEHQWLAFKTGHMQLLSSTLAFGRIYGWLKQEISLE